jgi:DNA-binding NtrC family response regulator
MTPVTEIGEEAVEARQAGAGEAGDDLISQGGTFQEFKDRAESAFILRQLEQHGWNISRTADALDIQRSHLYNKMKKYGLVRGDEE